MLTDSKACWPSDPETWTVCVIRSGLKLDDPWLCVRADLYADLVQNQPYCAQLPIDLKGGRGSSSAVGSERRCLHSLHDNVTHRPVWPSIRSSVSDNKKRFFDLCWPFSDSPRDSAVGLFSLTCLSLENDGDTIAGQGGTSFSPHHQPSIWACANTSNVQLISGCALLLNKG
jgi:hypothetical protein